MDEQIFITRIENYLNGQLSADQKRQFEAELSSNPELSRLFRQHKYFLDGIQGMKMQAFTKTFAPASRSTPVPRRTKFFIPVLITAMLVIIAIVYFVTRPPESQRLAKEYYSTPLAELSRSDSDAENVDYKAGMEAFDRKSWDAAIFAFDKIDASHPSYSQVRYFKGHALVGGRKYTEASSLFLEIAKQKGQYQEQAEWNLVITELFMNAPNAEIIEKVKAIENQPKHFYRENARELLQQLRKD